MELDEHTRLHGFPADKCACKGEYPADSRSAITLARELKTQPNEKRCHRTEQTHVIDLPKCCPVSGNPQPGSTVEIRYRPDGCHLEVASLADYIASYVGGKGDIRSMEGMIQAICQDAANTVGTVAHVRAVLVLEPGPQRMILECSAYNQR